MTPETEERNLALERLVHSYKDVRKLRRKSLQLRKIIKEEEPSLLKSLPPIGGKITFRGVTLRIGSRTTNKRRSFDNVQKELEALVDEIYTKAKKQDSGEHSIDAEDYAKKFYDLATKKDSVTHSIIVARVATDEDDADDEDEDDEVGQEFED